MLLINCKVELSIRWDSNCVLSNLVGASTFTITDIKLYVPIPIWSREDNAKLFKNIKWRISSLLEQIQSNSKQTMSCRWLHMRITSCQGVNRLFVLAYRDGGGADRVTADSHRRYFLPRVKIENYNIDIDGINFYDKPINDLIKQYDEVRKVSTGQGDDYTTGCLLDFAYFEKKYRLIAADLSKQKALDADSRAIQQIIFTGKANAGAMIYYILEQSKETTLH